LVLLWKCLVAGSPAGSKGWVLTTAPGIWSCTRAPRWPPGWTDHTPLRERAE
ncbi:hypothetical protein J6590_101531, partial [Homalodisca vitripennis]